MLCFGYLHVHASSHRRDAARADQGSNPGEYIHDAVSSAQNSSHRHEAARPAATARARARAPKNELGIQLFAIFIV